MNNYITLILEKTDEEYWVSVNELAGCYSSGTTVDEAIRNIKDAIAEYVSDLPEGIVVPELFYNEKVEYKINYDLASK